MAHETATAAGVWALMAEFDSADALVAAAHRLREAGYTKTDAYSPVPIHGLAEALGFRDRRLSKFVLAGGITGAIAGYTLQYWTSVYAYPINIGGRPLHAWVSFIPATFEMTILFAAFTAGITMLALNGLPQPYHPVFNAARFERASQDAFFLTIEASDPRFDPLATRELLSGLGSREVVDVEH